MLRLSELWIHPVKSLAGVRVPEAVVEDRGLRHDRRFMWVDPDGRFTTQRELPAMARLQPAIEGGRLLVRADGATLEVALDVDGAPRTVEVWGDRVDAVDAGDEAAAFFRRHLGAGGRLVRMPDAARRAADPGHARPGDLVSFADGFPFLLVTDGSLAALNERLERPVDVRRFRPNLVVSGAAPFAEDAWSELRVGPVTFFPRKACSRCRIVDVDPDRGEPGRAVLAALARFRKSGSRVLFGQNLVHDGRGVLREGDPVEVR
ncbi:MAG TPA: MOSC N-terminal beta barrel domain-containing protein [Sandaracinaceae bacterium LLY-WYZ-13_1]|nr:MOSC N-terminal beta barrel domain-containing protein [Sandaracinaceae bacterium LLY-WYZ-13_1]